MKVVLFWVSRIQLGKSGLGYCLVSFPAPSFSKSRATDSCNLDLNLNSGKLCAISEIHAIPAKDKCNTHCCSQIALYRLLASHLQRIFTLGNSIGDQLKIHRKKVSFKMRETNALRTNCVVDWGLSSLFVCLLHMYVCLLYLCVCLFVCLLVFPEEELWQTSVEACHLAFCQNQAFFSPNCRASPSRCASTDIFWSLGPKGWRANLYERQISGKQEKNWLRLPLHPHLVMP